MSLWKRYLYTIYLSMCVHDMSDPRIRAALTLLTAHLAHCCDMDAQRGGYLQREKKRKMAAGLEMKGSVLAQYLVIML